MLRNFFKIIYLFKQIFRWFSRKCKLFYDIKLIRDSNSLDVKFRLLLEIVSAFSREKERRKFSFNITWAQWVRILLTNSANNHIAETLFLLSASYKYQIIWEPSIPNRRTVCLVAYDNVHNCILLPNRSYDYFLVTYWNISSILDW